MRYTVGHPGDEITLDKEDRTVQFGINDEVTVTFSHEEFREFRRAVGYVWQEIEATNG